MGHEASSSAKGAASPQLGVPAGLAPGATTWVETDLGAIAANVRTFKRRIGESCGFAAVVKSDAYGHGVRFVAPTALGAGASMLAVVTLDEAIALRALVGDGVEIIVLGYVPTRGFEDAARADAQLTVYEAGDVPALDQAARRAGRPLRLHVKVETGTNRQGLRPPDALRLAEAIDGATHLRLEGLSTHFADIEDTTDHAFALRQMDAFRETRAMLEQASLSPRLIHAACSAAGLLFPDTHLDVARVGIGLYGLWPSRETLVSARERGLGDIELRPALSWRCVVAQVKDVPRGEFVGYGRTHRLTRDARLAVLPIGYYEGYDRAASGRGYVLVNGHRAPILGRICMNMMMIDVTDVPEARPGDVVTLIGRSGDETLRAEDLAGWFDTIHYEVVSRIGSSVPRLAIGGDERG